MTDQVEQDDTQAPQPKRKWSRVYIVGCTILTVIPILVCIWLYLSITYFPKIHAQQRAQEHERKWTQQHIDDYKLTVSYLSLGNSFGRTLTVCDGIVTKTETPYSYPDETHSNEFYQPYTIDHSFERAASCHTLCGVRFDEQYGYPLYMGGGFIEGWNYEIKDFQIIDCD